MKIMNRDDLRHVTGGGDGNNGAGTPIVIDGISYDDNGEHMWD
jgi:hypothetical protein